MSHTVPQRSHVDPSQCFDHDIKHKVQNCHRNIQQHLVTGFVFAAIKDVYIKQNRRIEESERAREMPKLIGFAGLQGSGKDSCGDVLANKGYVKCAFASPVKLFSKQLFDLSDDQLWGDSKNVVDDRYGLSPRQLMQKFGTDFVRDMICKSFWVDKFAEWYKDNQYDVVVCDVRFPDEAEIIQDLGGKVFMVKRPTMKRRDMHVSENIESLTVDGLIVNDGTLMDLTTKVETLEQEFLRDK